MEENKKSQPNAMAIISYIGFLCLVPILTKEKDEFVRFHMKQGLVLFIGEIAIYVLMIVIPILWIISYVVSIVWVVLSVIGILNVVRGKKKELPFIGKFASKINI